MNGKNTSPWSREQNPLITPKTCMDDTKTTTVDMQIGKSFPPDMFRAIATSELPAIELEDLPKYQKSEEYPPDHLPSWDENCPGHLENNTVSDAENSLLFEIQSMKHALLEIRNRGPLPSWACQSIKAWWEGHYLWVNARFDSFKLQFIPRLERRFHFPEDVKEALDSCYETFQALSSMIKHLSESSSLDALLDLWMSYEELSTIFASLVQTKLIVLYHAFFSIQDCVNITTRQVTKFMKDASTRVGAFIHFVGVHDFQTRILPRENYPSISWSLNFKKHYDAYLENSVAHLDALVSGKPLGQSQEISIVEKCRKRRRTMGEDDHIYFNPFDPIYQVSEEFLPDKLGEWVKDFEDHVKSCSRYDTNQAHLGEIKDMMNALMAVGERGEVSDWEMQSIHLWFNAHIEWISQLHIVDSEVLHPCYEKRFHYPQVLKDGSAEINAMLVQISFFLDSLKPQKVKLDGLISLWKRYSAKVNSFFDLFNRIHFPLVHSYFTRTEIAEIISSVVYMGPIGLGPLVYYKGKEKFRKETMKRENLTDLHWHMELGSRYITYVEKVVIHINALKSGVPPEEDDRGKTEILSMMDDQWYGKSDMKNRVDDGF